ncbi:hypothetical protein GF380_06100 [Candidatus Uhrbacteria bacterium]|nr:hypothetical protein [Candidatus Uhrbacteria bacterium]MBD3284549.1 hypothetical protein [Candidatus Uhrbacteria bacterium]
MAKCHHEPIYRRVLRDAFVQSWKEKRFWLIAAFAGALLSGSVYDVLLRGIPKGGPPTEPSFIGSLIPLWNQFMAGWSSYNMVDLVLGSLNALIITGFVLVITFALFAISVIAQGTLVYAINTNHRKKTLRVRDALTVGARALWPVLVLNLIALAVLLATRGLIGITLSILLTNESAVLYLLYLLSFVLFVGIGSITIVIQIFALNGMILQGATLAQAIARGWEVFRRHWVVTVETIAMLFVISVGATILAFALGMILSVPYFIMAMVAIASFASPALWSIVTIVFMIVYFLILLALFGYTVQLHYTTWTLMFRKLGEGGVLPKLHRLTRAFIHQTHVPGS